MAGKGEGSEEEEFHLHVLVREAWAGSPWAPLEGARGGGAARPCSCFRDALWTQQDPQASPSRALPGTSC